MGPAESLSSFLARARQHIDEALERYLPRPPACPRALAEAMRYSVFAGGKRLRPVLALASADAVSRATNPADAGAAVEDAVLPAACAIELIHTYSLIHDDLPAMDNDTLRRGRPTLHVVYGEGMAILAGDALLTEAFVLLAHSPRPDVAGAADRTLGALRVVAQAAGPGGMVAGQVIDLQAAGQIAGERLTLDVDGLRAMHAMKTGALIRASALVGAIHAGGSDAVVAAVREYGTEIGLAFQIVDDVLDVEGNAAELGKTVGKDAAAAKPTYPALFGIERSRAMAADCIARARAALERERLADGHLMGIAEWVVSRRN